MRDFELVPCGVGYGDGGGPRCSSVGASRHWGYHQHRLALGSAWDYLSFPRYVG